MGMINPVDALLSFGELDLTGSGAELPNVLDLNKAQTERMKVEVAGVAASVGLTKAVFTLKGCDTESGTYTTISTAEVASVAEGSVVTLPIPDGVNFRYLKVAVAKTGTATAGKVSAYLDTYLGI